jgi:hypothetical protein
VDHERAKCVLDLIVAIERDGCVEEETRRDDNVGERQVGPGLAEASKLSTISCPSFSIPGHWHSESYRELEDYRSAAVKAMRTCNVTV